MANPAPLRHGLFYHLYNRGNNREIIFTQEKNYLYFNQLYIRYIDPIADTFAFCLLPNHFHYLVRIKSEEKIPLLWRTREPSQYFSNLFNAYAKALNQLVHRTGSLFQRPFKRIVVTQEAYLLNLVAYIHRNPEKHELVADFRAWPYSSYGIILSNRESRIKRDEILAWFGGVEGFKNYHNRRSDEGNWGILNIEE